MKKDCDIIQDAQDQINASFVEEELSNEQAVDDTIYVGSKPKWQKVLNKWLGDGKREVSAKELDKYFGALPEREKMAQKIDLILKAFPDISETILQEFKHRIANVGMELPSAVIYTDADGKKKIALEELPLPMLRGFHKFAHNWTNANGKNWDTFYYRNLRLPFGLPKKLRFEENTGAYNDLFLATQRYADIQGVHIKRFNHGKTVGDRGMHDILTDVENIYYKIPDKFKLPWLKGGFLKGRTIRKAKANLTSIFTDMMRGRILNVSSHMATTEKIVNKDTGKEELRWKHGAGLYINTQWAPTGKNYKSTGDAIFAWQNPVPFKYNAKYHSNLRDHRGNLRHDTMKYIENSLPISDDMITRLEGLVAEARVIDNDFFKYAEKQMTSSFQNIIDAVMVHFPNKDKDQVKEVFETKEFDKFWTDEEKQTFKYLEENFTQYSLSAPFLYDGTALEHKDNHFPYIFMPDTYILLLSEAIDNITTEVKKLETDAANETGEAALAFYETIDGLESSLRHMKQLKQSLLSAPEDMQVSAQMVARTNSKHFKHISNAFDMLKARSDRHVYLNYLEHNARAIERNNLTADLIRSLNKAQDGPVKEAMINLYKRTIGRSDVRSTLLGLNISDENLNPMVVRNLRAMRKWWTLMLANPVTTSRNYMGHIEKFNKVGVDKALAAFQYIHDFKDNKALKNLIADSGVDVFGEFFTHSIVKDLEENEIERATIQGVVDAFVEYYTGPMTQAAETILRTKITKFYGKAMKDGNMWLNAEEAKAFGKKMKQDRLQNITNKVVNFAIANEYQMSEALKNAPAIIGGPTWTKKQIASLAEALVRGREVVDRFAVMTEAETHLRVTSFILGVWGAQKVGLIGPGRIHELTGADRAEAVKYGRYATNFMFDFGMSKQHAGEIHGSSAGQIAGQFTIWRTQKASSDIDLFRHAGQTMNTDYMPIGIIKALGTAMNPIKYPASLLKKTNPDALMLRRWLKGQFLIEGLMQSIFLAGSVLPAGIRQIARATGATKLGAAGSNIAAWFWMPVLLMMQAAMGDDDDDAARIEQGISYMLRQIPVAGLGIGLIYDLSALIFALIADEEEILEDKIIQGTNYLAPIPGLNSVKREVLELVKD